MPTVHTSFGADGDAPVGLISEPPVGHLSRACLELWEPAAAAGTVTLSRARVADQVVAVGAGARRVSLLGIAGYDADIDGDARLTVRVPGMTGGRLLVEVAL